MRLRRNRWAGTSQAHSSLTSETPIRSHATKNVERATSETPLAVGVCMHSTAPDHSLFTFIIDSILGTGKFERTLSPLLGTIRKHHSPLPCHWRHANEERRPENGREDGDVCAAKVQKEV